MLNKLKSKLSIIIASVIALSVISGVTVFAIKTNQGHSNIIPLVLPNNGDGAGVHDMKISLKNGLSFNQDTCKVYKFKKNKISNSDVSKLAKTMGLDSNVKDDNVPNRYSVEKGNEIFWMEKDSGKWAYEDLSKLYKSPKGIINMPSDEEAIKIAEQQIKKMGLDPSLFGNAIMSNQTEQDTVQSTPKILAKDVFFYKKFNGEELLGRSRVIVTIGNNGEIQAVKKFFRDIDETPYDVKLKPIEKVLDDVKNGNSMIRYSGKDKDTKEIEISSVKLAYWEDATNDYLQPVYFLSGYNKNNVNDTFEAFVTAIEE